MNTHLRPADDGDVAFLFSLHVTTMRELIEQTWGWDEEWQRKDFDTRYKRCRVSVIEEDAAAVGALWVEERPGSLFIADLQVVPACQGRGIGTFVIRRTIDEAERRRLNVELAVLERNPRARLLYERLGFIAERIEPPWTYMRYGFTGSTL